MPETNRPAAVRDTLFISLAMPEDEDFGVWLSIQLAQQGYRVWSESTKLVGGERFWNDIEDALNTSVIKMIYVVSRASRRKDGVQNELDHARVVATRRLRMPTEKFIQAVILDDLEPDEIPIQLSGRNAIFFYKSWAEGLARLLKVLERDSVPRVDPDLGRLNTWVRDKFAEGRHVLQLASIVATNICPILSFPENIWLYEFKAALDLGKPETIRSHFPWPNFMHGRLLGTFATPEEVLGILPTALGASVRGKVATADFLSHGARDPAVERREARKFVTSMAREAWNCLCKERGLLPMRKSETSVGWFYPSGGAKRLSSRFVDLDGRTRSKALHGIKTRSGRSQLRAFRKQLVKL